MNYDETYQKRRAALCQQFDDILACKIHCGAGWFLIIEDLLNALVTHVEAAGFSRKHLSVTRLKEKYGTLRCDYRAPIDLDAVTDRYELHSAMTCEHCGRLGRIREAGWVKTLCDNCAVEKNVPVTELDVAKLPAGAKLQLVDLGNDQVAVTLIDLAGDNQSSMRQSHRNDVPLAVAELLGEMLQIQSMKSGRQQKVCETIDDPILRAVKKQSRIATEELFRSGKYTQSDFYLIRPELVRIAKYELKK